MPWISQRTVSFSGIGGGKQTLGKRQIPVGFPLVASNSCMDGSFESHERENGDDKGDQPCLLSKHMQAKLGMVKDMRSGRITLEGGTKSIRTSADRQDLPAFASRISPGRTAASFTAQR